MSPTSRERRSHGRSRGRRGLSRDRCHDRQGRLRCCICGCVVAAAAVVIVLAAAAVVVVAVFAHVYTTPMLSLSRCVSPLYVAPFLARLCRVCIPNGVVVGTHTQTMLVLCAHIALSKLRADCLSLPLAYYVVDSGIAGAMHVVAAAVCSPSRRIIRRHCRRGRTTRRHSAHVLRYQCCE